MEHFIEYIYNFILSAMVVLGLIYVSNQIERPQNKAEYLGLLLGISGIAAIIQLYFIKVNNDPLFMTELVKLVRNKLANPM